MCEIRQTDCPLIGRRLPFVACSVLVRSCVGTLGTIMKASPAMAPIRPLPRRRGYTLTEVLVVVAITGILGAYAVPSFNQFSQKILVEKQVSSLNSAIRLTRAEAVKRGQRVSLCPSLAPEAAAPQCAGAGADWSRGWLIFTDGGAVLNQIEAGETVIYVQPEFRGSGGITNNMWAAIAFQPSGLPAGMLPSAFRVLPKLSDAQTSPLVRDLVISAPGRTRIDKPNKTPKS